MSKRIQVLILAVLSAISISYLIYVWPHTGGPLIATGSGPSGAPLGWKDYVALFAAALTSLGFSWKTLMEFADNLTDFIPAGLWRTAAKSAVDAGQEALYESAFRGAKSKEERDSIRVAAKLAAEKRIAEKFPEEKETIEAV